MVHGIRERKQQRGKGRGEWFWSWSRMTSWRALHAVMQTAGSMTCPPCSMGLGIAAVSAGIPLNLAQKWIGLAQLSTNGVYVNAVGAEE